jgi:hypothetical protein
MSKMADGLLLEPEELFFPGVRLQQVRNFQVYSEKIGFTSTKSWRARHGDIQTQ